MLEKKLYQQVTKCIKETLDVLPSEDDFLLSELSVLTHVIERTPRGCLEALPQGPLPECSKEEVILLVEEFLSQCSPSYSKKFLEDYETGKIIISPDVSENKIEVIYSPLSYLIYIQQQNTLDDAISLVHEYFHALNLNPFTYRQGFTESVSITAELLFLDFLKSKGLSTYDISLISNRRNVLYGYNAAFLRKVLPLYTEVATTGSITDKTYKKYAHNYFGKEDYLSTLTDSIIGSKDKVEDITSYRHTIGYIAASVFHQLKHSSAELSLANEALRISTEKSIEVFNLLLGYHIFMTDYPDYVISELNHFKVKTKENKSKY